MSSARDIRMSATDASGSLATITDIVLRQPKGNSAMTNFTLIGAVAALLLVAAPAIAKQHVDHYRYGYSHRLPRSVYGAYGFYRGGDSLPSNISGDFDRRNTFN
jgi:hypothetical protein